MGFVVANDHFFGLEGAGIVSRIGESVKNVKPGDRVMVVSTKEKGCFANRVRTDCQGVHRIPDWMSFEVCPSESRGQPNLLISEQDGATLGTCYLTVIHCLVNLGNVRRGQVLWANPRSAVLSRVLTGREQSVLIHSATGGVGLAAVQLCKYLGAEVSI